MTHEILTNEQMAAADRMTIESGTAGLDLMNRAGKAAASIIIEHYGKQDVLVLCGPGNNGGDGFIIATILQGEGWGVTLACLVPIDTLQGDAAQAAAFWNGAVLSFEHVEIMPETLVIDAVFGTGFSRDFEPPVSDVFQAVQEQGNTVIAIDIPSGVNGSTGTVVSYTPTAALTITFCRKKLGHVLMPGMEQCGEVIVCDIGITDETVTKSGYEAIENTPDLWRSFLHDKSLAGNKYVHGHTLVFGGPLLTGAARLAAEASMRIGSGLCTIVGHESAADVYRSGSPHIMYEPWQEYGAFDKHLKDTRRNAVLVGPGAGLDDPEGLRQAVTACCLRRDKSCVIDADALTAFCENPEKLYKVLHKECVLTPHEGEFERIFPSLLQGHKVERCREAARLSKAIILLKGADTVIAHPDGDVVININATPDLATGGSGDVLAGIITGLLARGLPAFEAACAGAWIHGRAAQIFGHGLVATDISAQIPAILNEIT